MKWKFNLGSKPERHAASNSGFYHQVGHKPPSWHHQAATFCMEKFKMGDFRVFLKNSSKLNKFPLKGKTNPPFGYAPAIRTPLLLFFKVDLAVLLGKANKPVIIYFGKIPETFWLNYNLFQFQKCVSTRPHLTTFTKNYNSSFYYFNC